MTPLDWAVRPLKKFADFSGRAPRAEYWWFYLATVIIQIPLTLLDKVFGTWSPLSTLFSLVVFAPWLAVTVRRLHDTDKSGWWMLAFVVALGLIIVMAAISAMAAFDRRLGTQSVSVPTNTGMIIAVLLVVLASITMLVLMVLPGTEGPNRYGPDPYGPDELEEVFA